MKTFTLEEIFMLNNEFESYKAMYDDALDGYIHHDAASPAQLVGFTQWLYLNQEGWSNDEIISGYQASSIEL